MRGDVRQGQRQSTLAGMHALRHFRRGHTSCRVWLDVLHPSTLASRAIQAGSSPLSEHASPIRRWIADRIQHTSAQFVSSTTPRCVMVVSLRRTAAIAFALLGFATGAASAQTGSISGRVTDVDGGRAIVGATVRALTATGATAAAAMTNDEGQYRLAVSPGTYTVSARRVGYGATEQRAVIVSEGGTADINLTMATVAVELDVQVVTAGRVEQKALEA